MLNGKIFRNSNGRDYEVIELNTLHEVAILKPSKPTFKEFPYMVATGFTAESDSWNNGNYDMTLEEAKSLYNTRTYR